MRHGGRGGPRVLVTDDHDRADGYQCFSRRLSCLAWCRTKEESSQATNGVRPKLRMESRLMKNLT